MGKTHLMHAIGHEVKRRQPMASICYVSAEKFTNEMITSLRNDRMTSFRDRFRTVDVLLIDDIQFIAQKERTQEEFFHTFNALHESMKQIVIASDRPPKELAEIEDRLRSRFEWGLIADIQPPDLETKVAILQKKAESEQVQLPTDVALFVASNVRTNVRELEGALVRLIAWCQLNRMEITLASTQQCLKQFIDMQVRKITIEAIQRAVAEQFGMRVSDLKQKNNSRNVVVPRQIAMYLAKQMTEASLPEIGRQFGNKHHTTVMHSIAKIDEQRRADKDLHRTLNKLQEQLSGAQHDVRASGSNQKLNSWRGLGGELRIVGLRIQAAAHHHDALGQRGKLRIDGDGERNVGQRSGGVDRHLVRMRVHLADEEVRGVFVDGLERGHALGHGRNLVRPVRLKVIRRHTGLTPPVPFPPAWSAPGPTRPATSPCRPALSSSRVSSCVRTSGKTAPLATGTSHGRSAPACAACAASPRRARRCRSPW
jgi:hypothetical protein